MCQYDCVTSLALIASLLFGGTLAAQSGRVKEFKERYTVATDKRLRVDIDIDAGEVKFRKSPRTAEARVTIYYDEEAFRVYSDFDERRSRITVEFDKKGWADSNDRHVHAEAIIELPPGVALDLDAKINAGEVDIDLGGLSLVNFNLTTWAGEVLVDFSEPNRTEMDFLQINTKIGETRIVRLGNARFKDAEINGSIGEMTVNFRGTLLSHADARIDLDIGETRLHLPEEVGVKLSVSKFLFMSDISMPRSLRKSGRYYYSQNFDDSERRLHLDISPGLGELQIDYY